MEAQGWRMSCVWPAVCVRIDVNHSGFTIILGILGIEPGALCL